MKHFERSKAALFLLVGCCLATSCSRPGKEVVKVQSVVPYHRLDLREFGPPQGKVFFLMGLHCLNPLTLVYSMNEGPGIQDPDRYYALVRNENGWSKVHLTGKLPNYHVNSYESNARPPDGRAYRSKPETGEPHLGGRVNESIISGLPSGLDLSFIDLSKAKAGVVGLFRFHETDPMQSLLHLNYVFEVGQKDAIVEVYSLGQRKKLIEVKLKGYGMFHLRMVARHQFGSGRLDSGFLLFQPNFNEVLIFDLREYWPKFPQNPGEPEPQCVPLI